MKRLIVLIGCLLLIAGYQYAQHLEREKVAAAAAEAVAEASRQRVLLRARHDKLVAEARGLLDAWAGNSERLAKAAANLQQVIQGNPAHVPARIEMARLIIRAGYINYRNYQPGTLQKAEQELRIALSQDRNSADAYVLLGHVHYLSSRSEEALKALGQAEKLGTDNPWLYLNWADALIDLRRQAEAETYLDKAQAKFATMQNPPKSAVRGMLEKKAGVLVAQRKLDEADKAYQALIEFDPNYAWTRGNYAGFLLLNRGQPDAAIVQVQKALEIMDYGMARQILAASLYAKWAELKPRSPKEAAQYLEAAKELSMNFSWIMPQAAKSVSAGPAIQNMVKALVAAGVPLDTKDEHEDTGLTLAADLGNTESVALLLKLGANIESKDNYGRTAIAIAAGKGHLETVKLLAARKAKVDTLDRANLTPLHIAIVQKDEAMVRLLISLKADINNAAAEYTPLMRAVSVGHEGLVRLLLESGADPSRKAPTVQKTAVDMAREKELTALAELISQAATQTGAKVR